MKRKQSAAAAAFFAPRSTKTRTAAADGTRYRGVAVPAPFRVVRQHLLVATFYPQGRSPTTNLNTPREKEEEEEEDDDDDDDHRGGNEEAGVIKRKTETKTPRPLAGFDFDDTLARYDFRRPDAAPSTHAHAASTLRHLSDDRGFAVAVLSNESLDRFTNLGPLQKKLASKCARLERWVRENERSLSLETNPLLVCVALSKKDDTGRFHKSVGDGMWRYAIETLLSGKNQVVDAAASFFVGDSADDRNLARCAGVTFHHVDHFFRHLFPPPPSTSESESESSSSSEDAQKKKMMMKNVGA